MKKNMLATEDVQTWERMEVFLTCVLQSIIHMMCCIIQYNTYDVLLKSLLHFAFLHLLFGYYYYDCVVIGVMRPSWLLLLRLCSNRCDEALVAYRNSLLNRWNIVHGGKILTIIIIIITTFSIVLVANSTFLIRNCHSVSSKILI